MKTIRLQGQLLTNGKLDLTLSPFETWTQFLDRIKPHLKHGVAITDIRLTDESGRAITSPEAITDRQRLLVKAQLAPEETEWPSPPNAPQVPGTGARGRGPGGPPRTRIVIYLGTDPSAWKSLPRAQRCAIIQGEIASDPPKDANLIRVTMDPMDVDKPLVAYRHKFHVKAQASTTYSPAYSLATISQNWGVDAKALTTALKTPSGSSRQFTPRGPAEAWDTRLLATMAIFSEFTAGQVEVATDSLHSAVQIRCMDPSSDDREAVYKEADAMRAINDILGQVHPNRGNVTLAQLDREEKERVKKRAYRERKKAEKAAGGKKPGEGGAGAGAMA